MTETADPSEPETLADKIKLEEYRGLRNEIELRGGEQRAMERNTVLLSASIYGFLLYPKAGTVDCADRPFLLMAWYLPPLFSFLALIRWRESVKMIEALASYLLEIEMSVFSKGGWEAHLDRERRKQKRLPLVSRWYLLFWVVVIIGALVVALLRCPPPIGHSTQITAAVAVIGTFIVAAFVTFPSNT